MVDKENFSGLAAEISKYANLSPRIAPGYVDWIVYTVNGMKLKGEDLDYELRTNELIYVCYTPMAGFHVYCAKPGEKLRTEFIITPSGEVSYFDDSVFGDEGLDNLRRSPSEPPYYKVVKASPPDVKKYVHEMVKKTIQDIATLGIPHRQEAVMGRSPDRGRGQ